MTGADLKQMRCRRGLSSQTLAELIGASDKRDIRELEQMDEIPEYYERRLKQALGLSVPGRRKGARTISGVRFE